VVVSLSRKVYLLLYKEEVFRLLGCEIFYFQLLCFLLARKKHLHPASSSKRRGKKIESPSWNLPPTNDFRNERKAHLGRCSQRFSYSDVEHLHRAFLNFLLRRKTSPPSLLFEEEEHTTMKAPLGRGVGEMFATVRIYQTLE
jgi:hypothetical protein